MLWQSRPGRWGPAEALAAAQARRAGCTTTSTTTCTCSCAAASACACSRRPRPAACTRAGGRAWCTPTAASCTTGRRAARPPCRTRLHSRLSALHGRGRTGVHAHGTSTGAQRPFAFRKRRCERSRVQRSVLMPYHVREGRCARGWSERGGRGRVAAPARGGRLRGRRRGAGCRARRRAGHARGGRQRVRQPLLYPARRALRHMLPPTLGLLLRHMVSPPGQPCKQCRLSFPAGHRAWTLPVARAGARRRPTTTRTAATSAAASRARGVAPPATTTRPVSAASTWPRPPRSCGAASRASRASTPPSRCSCTPVRAAPGERSAARPLCACAYIPYPTLFMLIKKRLPQARHCTCRPAGSTRSPASATAARRTWRSTTGARARCLPRRAQAAGAGSGRLGAAGALRGRSVCGQGCGGECVLGASLAVG